MSLQYVFGGSGSGKSHYVFSKIIDESAKNLDIDYIVVVPEQFTMSTQKTLVNMHPKKGILNIDVVSFQRLAYKVFEEVGGGNKPILDDTGKNLILRRVLERNKSKLSYFGNNINNSGFVEQMKSIISELMQYDLSVDGLSEVVAKLEEAGDKPVLAMKLKDIQIIYREFKEFLKDNYITNEEVLDVLTSVIHKSEKIKHSVIVMDGFTGFTPIQYKLIEELLKVGIQDIYVTLTLDTREQYNVYEGYENLFFMTKQTVSNLNRICDECHVQVEKPYFVEMNEELFRFKNSKELAFLERNLFRVDSGTYKDEPDNILLYSGGTVKDEVEYVVGRIIELTRLQGYRYSDIAIVTADLEGYGSLVSNILLQNEIPHFLDSKRKVKSNPFIEMIRGALQIIEKGYTYDSVMHFLRTGMSELTRDEVDILDNYLLACGIKGRRMWEEKWTRYFRRYKNVPLSTINNIKDIAIEPVLKLHKALLESDKTVEAFVKNIYAFIVDMQGNNKINDIAKLLDSGNEYEQLYAKTMGLLDKIYELMGSQKTSIREFSKILDSGFEEIKIGLIPQTRDSVVVGDIMRTRLDNIKVLFFIGVNDGLVPKNQANSGVLSEMDRNTLSDMKVNLSPNVNEKSFTERFYLYLIMTKASDRLYLTYANKTNDGKGLLPSYLIYQLKKMFPKIKTYYANSEVLSRRYLKIPKSELVWSEDNFLDSIGEEIALELYGNELVGSVTSFENFVGCNFAYYMAYGLGIEQREEYSFAMNDFGNLIHSVLEQVSTKLKNDKKSISELSDKERADLVKESVYKLAPEYNNAILKSSKRNEFMMNRFIKFADRTLWVIGKQLADGSFSPEFFEQKFVTEPKMLKGGRSLVMKGKIDRVDLYEDDENVYVKIVDYKSGTSDFNLLKTYHGVKLQLVTYMREAINSLKLKYKDTKKNIIPAGMFILNVDDPIVSDIDEDDTKTIETELRKELKQKGIANSDKSIIKLLDNIDTGASLNIPVEIKKDKELSSRSKVMSTEQFELIGKHLDKLSGDIAKEVFDGSIKVNPYNLGDGVSSCTYCLYNSVCGFSLSLPGNKYRKLKKMDTKEIWDAIKAENDDEPSVEETTEQSNDVKDSMETKDAYETKKKHINSKDKKGE